MLLAVQRRLSSQSRNETDGALLGSLFSARSSRLALLGSLFSARSSRLALLGPPFRLRSRKRLIPYSRDLAQGLPRDSRHVRRIQRYRHIVHIQRDRIPLPARRRQVARESLRGQQQPPV